MKYTNKQVASMVVFFLLMVGAFVGYYNVMGNRPELIYSPIISLVGGFAFLALFLITAWKVQFTKEVENIGLAIMGIITLGAVYGIYECITIL